MTFTHIHVYAWVVVPQMEEEAVAEEVVEEEGEDDVEAPVAEQVALGTDNGTPDVLILDLGNNAVEPVSPSIFLIGMECSMSGAH